MLAGRLAMCSQADGSNGGRVVDPRLIGSCSQRMRLQPKRAGLDGRINAGLLPPIGLVPAAVHFTMMTSAQRHGEFVADFASEGRVLRKPQVMGVARPPAANQARLLSNRFDVIAVADPTRLGDGQHALVDCVVNNRGGRRPPSSGSPPRWRFFSALDRFSLCLGRHRCLCVLARQPGQPGFEGLLHACCIGRGETVLGAERPLCPGGGRFR